MCICAQIHKYISIYMHKMYALMDAHTNMKCAQHLHTALRCITRVKIKKN